jgi:UDP-N-acetylmuramoyl-tripeptide--D-alanyl-D-alanine ligase
LFSIADALEALTGKRPPESGPVLTEASLTEAAVDSRQVIPGSLFVALVGERTDGHHYVETAFKNGANVALIQNDLVQPLLGAEQVYPIIDLRSGNLPVEIPEPPFCLQVENTLTALQKIASFWRRKLTLRVIGITGSVGKSTTKELVAEVLSQRYRTLKNPGNQNNEIGLPLTLLRLTSGHQRAVLEMGFYVPGEIRFLCDLARPSVGVITNIGTVHAERAGSQEAIARGKAELVESLPPAPEGVAILNMDDPLVRAMAEKTRARVFYYGLDTAADLWADDVEGLGLEGIRFRLHYQNEVLHMRVPLIGQHSVHTALRAAAVGLVEGLTWQDIGAGLRQGHTQLRLVAVHTETGALLLDDTYNASPESTLAALNLLNDLEGRKVAVLGDMLELGPYETQGHEMVGVRAAEIAQELVLVGDRAEIIGQAARHSGLSPSMIHWFKTTDEASDYLRQSLAEKDVVLVKGSRGMRMDRIVAALEVTQ